MPNSAPVDVLSAVALETLVVERTLSASPERVFNAFTDPRQLTQWWWPAGFSCPRAEVDLRIGGTYRLEMEWPEFIPVEARFSHYLGGEYYEISRPGRLVMSGRALTVDNEELFATLIEVTLLPVEGGCALTMRQSYFAPLPPPEAMGGAHVGWSQQLDKLEVLLDSPELRDDAED